MLKKRLIAVILVRNGQVVQSVRFKHTNIIHYDPVYAIDSFNRWAVDEILVLNVTRDRSACKGFVEVLKRISGACFVPLAAGGWVEDVSYARQLLQSGADKVVVNTRAFEQPDFITELAGRFGKQCVVVSIDARKNADSGWNVVVDRGRDVKEADAVAWAARAVSMGAGELMVNSLDHDGNRKGYDLELIRRISQAVNVPVIAMGGVFSWQDLADGIEKAGVDAVAAANIFHYTEQSTKKAKAYLLSAGLDFRPLGNPS